SFNLQDPTAPSHTESNLVPGLFNVNEAATAGWTLSNINCQSTLGASTYQYSADTGDVDVTLAPGDDVTCTFTNEKSSTLTIIKDAEPNDDLDFEFTLSGDASDSFMLDDANPDDGDGVSNSQSYTLPQGNYVVSETVPSGWVTEAPLCTSTASNIGKTSDTVFIDLASGDDVTCTFRNRKMGTITVVKDAIPADDTNFDFYVRRLPLVDETFTLQDPSAPSHTVADLAPKISYFVGEQVPAGWTLDDLVCTSALGSLTYTVDLAAGQARVRLQPGDDVTCTFKNQENKGAIVVEKRTVPAGGVNFGFAITDTVGVASSFALSDTEQYTLTNVPTGIYTVTEDAPSFGFLSGLRCDDGTSTTPSTVDIGARTAHIKLDPGETVTCTFVNTEDDLIIIEKVTWPAGGAGFGFSSDIPGSATFTLDDFGQNIASVTPGTYTITETNSGPDYDLTAIECGIFGPGPNDFTIVNGDINAGSVSVPLTAAGQGALCYFENTKRGSITVVKKASPDDDTAFDFGINGNGSYSTSFNLQDPTTPSHTESNLAPGLFNVNEAVTAGWTLSNINCQSTLGASTYQYSAATGDADVTLAPGDDVTCTFTNEKQSKLTIVKVAEPADGANFDFILGNDASDTFQLDDASPDDNDGISNSTSYTLPQGSYAITETVPAGWELTSHGCQGTFSFSAGADNTQFVVLGPGDEATCTFHNRKLGSITVVKEATPADDTPFDFALNSLVSTQSFTLQDPSAPSHTVSNLSPKRPYVVTEQLPAGWTLDDIVCTSTLSTSTTDVFPSAGGARIFLEPGDDVTCTFKNREETSITVVKETAGGDATFAFTSSALGNFNLTTAGGTTQTVFSNLAAGSYDITEQSQAGWTPADSPTCSNGADPANVTIGAGDTITCTFRNVKLASITVLKLAEGGNDTFSFSSQALGDFNLATSGGTGQQVFANLQPGAYDIFENNKAGWEIVGIPLCSNGKFPSNVTINAGDNITCTFKNRKLGSLTIVKQTQSGNGAFDFSSQTLTPTTFSLATVNGAAQRVFSDLAPNSTYDVTEQTPSGWELKSATCSDGSAPNAIRIDAGEQVTCTFVNARKSSPPTNTPTKTPTKKPTNAPTNTPAPPTHTPTPAPTQPTNGPTNTPVHTPDASTTPASTPSVTGTPPATHTPDASTTPTGTPQVTGTPDATPTPDGTPAAQPLILVSASRSGTVDGIEFHDEDILAYDPNTDQWLMVFDGSDIGWGNVDLEAFTVLADGSFLLTPSKSLSIPNLGTVTPSDIVRFVPTQLGQITAGTLEWYLDGSDVELTTTGEYIDAIAIDSTGRLVISTEGTFKFGGTTEAHDEDLTAFNANTLGMDTSGTWAP
ncbi:MAG: hypothetical protein KDE31_17350, partial [Caldilineaceae bacterium]|nr:hypothetical protein [Caldilineaceae bacterium]